MNRTKLINALKSVLVNLAEDKVDYDWSETNKCNMGLVARSITGTLEDEFMKKYWINISREYKLKKNKHITGSPWWSDLANHYCPTTGMPMVKIFQILYEAGMTKQDIINLETLKDEKILSLAGISKEPIVTYKHIAKTKTVTKINFLGFRKIEKENTGEVETIVDSKKEYYQSKENFIKYITAWIKILEQETIVNIKVAEKQINLN